MQQHHFVMSKFPLMVFMLCVGLTGTWQVLAAADPYDEQSVIMGAQLYELYCSDCHGADTTGRYSEL